MGLHKHQTNSTSFKKGMTPWNKCKTVYERGNRITVNGKIVYEHRQVYEETFGKIPKGFIIHHIDGNNKNNSIENLKLLTQSEHIKLHHKQFKEMTQ
jgi:hypothetical protein